MKIVHIWAVVFTVAALASLTYLAWQLLGG
jgi:hypothetical protein